MTYTHPNALLQRARIAGKMGEVLVYALGLNMDVLMHEDYNRCSMYGSEEQWRRLAAKLEEHNVLSDSVPDNGGVL